MHAEGCTVPATLVLAYQNTTCDAGANEVWDFHELSGGYDEIVAYYSGHLVCVSASYSPLSGRNCDSGSIPASEQWREPEHSPDGYFNGDCASNPCAYFIVPSQNYGLTWNIQGGGDTGGNIILSGQNSSFADAWWFY